MRRGLALLQPRTNSCDNRAYSRFSLCVINRLPQQFCILNQAKPCVYPSQFDTLYLGGNIPPSVHLPHASPCIEHRYVPLLELVFLTCDTCFLLYIIAFIFLRKNKKRQAGREYYLILAVVMSPLNREQSY